MANLRETSVWEAGIYQLETSDPVMGGENGVDNKAPRQLANRTLWLKNELARQIGLVNQNNTNLNNQKANKTTQFTAGAGLTGGGDLSASRSLSLGTPSKITANSTNTAASNTHSHEIDKASTTTQGIVQLVDNLTSNANNQALTAKQGKVLNDTKLGNTGTQTLNGQLITTNPIKINNPSTWAGIEMVSGDGSWILETNPAGSVDRRLNFKFLKDGENSLFIAFAKIDKNETVAYQSWVQDSFLAKTANAASATKLHTPRNIAMTGDGTWSVNFDGSQNATGALTLANSGVTAGSYNSVTVDAKGRVTRGLTQTHGLVTATTATGTTNVATGNGNTFLNIVASGVGQTASVGSSTQITGTNGIAVSSDTAGKLIVGQTLANNLTDNSATKPLSANMGKVLKEELTALDGRKFEQRGILGLTDLNSLTTISHAGIWHQAGDINATPERNYPVRQAGTLWVLPSAYAGQQLYLPYRMGQFYTRTTQANGGWTDWIAIGETINALNNTSTTAALSAAQGKILKEQIDTKLASHANAVSATKLHTARTINGVAFDGTANITISDNTKVGKSGNETITGVKTFSSSPKAPTPPADSNDTTVATTAFVRTAITSNTAVLTGTIAHGGTLPLPAGFSEAQCKFMVSVNKDNPNRSGWDINESGSHFHYGFECWLDGRTVHVGALRGHYGHATFTPGIANYMVVGIK